MHEIMDKLKKKDISQRDKIELVKIKAEAMEQKAQFYEKGIKARQIKDKD